MITHQKQILQQVDHNPDLFKKELVKSLRWLQDYEQTQFKKWVCEKYYHQYPVIINQVLDEYAPMQGDDY
ncbi:hypothetical protein SAMN06265379_10725 [Saccharicrinis carchari]|uniref:Uncharacterized protein n=1 Tax=Saccharicrinis carchari TaxID=1168039 RepID=A0A521DY24_SACCC|nr:hypothetical protein [Saccharicrinis carchari]SMO76576.1 hypothetical protein SAMN06265379_10725 [Saccharicrinis carchari]